MQVSAGNFRANTILEIKLQTEGIGLINKTHCWPQKELKQGRLLCISRIATGITFLLQGVKVNNGSSSLNVGCTD